MPEIHVFLITKDLWKEDPGLSTDERKVLNTHVGEFAAAEKSERGFRILVRTITQRRETTFRLAEKLLKEGY